MSSTAQEPGAVQECAKCGLLYSVASDKCPSCNSEMPAKPAQRAGNSNWEMLPISALIPGVVMAYTRSHLSGPAWLLPTGLAYAFCVTNPNFRFNGLQKIIATLIALIIGTYGQQILAWFMHP